MQLFFVNHKLVFCFLSKNFLQTAEVAVELCDDDDDDTVVAAGVASVDILGAVVVVVVVVADVADAVVIVLLDMYNVAVAVPRVAVLVELVVDEFDDPTMTEAGTRLCGLISVLALNVWLLVSKSFKAMPE